MARSVRAGEPRGSPGVSVAHVDVTDHDELLGGRIVEVGKDATPDEVSPRCVEAHDFDAILSRGHRAGIQTPVQPVGRIVQQWRKGHRGRKQELRAIDVFCFDPAVNQHEMEAADGERNRVTHPDPEIVGQDVMAVQEPWIRVRRKPVDR